jgi:hypothetical protein
VWVFLPHTGSLHDRNAFVIGHYGLLTRYAMGMKTASNTAFFVKAL